MQLVLHALHSVLPCTSMLFLPAPCAQLGAVCSPPCIICGAPEKVLTHGVGVIISLIPWEKQCSFEKLRAPSTRFPCGCTNSNQERCRRGSSLVFFSIDGQGTPAVICMLEYISSSLLTTRLRLCCF